MNTDEHGLKRSIHGLRYVEEKGANPLPHLCDHPPTVSPVVWQRFSGTLATNAGNFHQAIGQPVGRAACHVRPKAFYVACRVRRLVHRSLGEVGSLLRGIFPSVNRQSLNG
jgi:hypothetical protein